MAETSEIDAIPKLGFASGHIWTLSMCWVVVEIRMNITLIRAEIPLIRSSHFNFEISHVFLSLQPDFKKVSDTGTFVMVSQNAV